MAVKPPWLDEACVMASDGKHMPQPWRYEEGDTPGFACRHCHRTWSMTAPGVYRSTWDIHGWTGRTSVLTSEQGGSLNNLGGQP